MVRRIGICLLIMGIASSTSFGFDEPASTGTIVGRVVDLQGKPVANATVWGTTYPRKEVARTHADADGRFRLGPLAENDLVDVWFEGPDLARDRREHLHAFPGRDFDLGLLTLVPGTRIKGRIVDNQGRAIAGARIKLEVYHRVLGHTISSDQKTWELSTDDQGRFRSLPLPPGEAVLKIAANGKVRTRIDRRTMPGTPEMDVDDVRLEDEVPLRGVIVDQGGNPAPKVEVVADYDYENVAITDKEGRFSLGGIGREAKEIRLTSNDYFAIKPFPIGPDREKLRLEVIKAYEILGSAVDAETGQPVKLDTVRLCVVVHEPDGTTSLRG